MNNHKNSISFIAKEVELTNKILNNLNKELLIIELEHNQKNNIYKNIQIGAFITVFLALIGTSINIKYIIFVILILIIIGALYNRAYRKYKYKLLELIIKIEHR